jgi:hypothetical protein
MKLTRDSLLAIGLLVVLVVIMAVVAVSQQQNQDAQNLPRLTSLSAAPDGALALKRWLQKLNYTISEETPATYRLPEKVKIVFALEPIDFSQRDLDTLEQWIRDGGTLIAAGEIYFRSLAEHFDFELDSFDDDPSEYTLQTPLLLNPLLKNNIPQKRASFTSSRYLIPSRSPYVTYLAADGKPVLVSFDLGSGRVILSTITHPFTNAGLKEAGNPELLLNLLGLAKNQGPVWFDEWHHGIRGTEIASGPEAWLRQTPLGRSVFFVAMIIFLALLFAGRSFGRPVPLPRELRRRGALEHVSAMANLSRMAGHRASVLHEYYQQLKRTLGRRYRLDPALPDEDYVAKLTDYNPAIDGAALLNLLTRLRQTNVGEKELVTIAADAAKWIRDSH